MSDYHSLKFAEVLNGLNATLEGLTAAEAEKRYGRNGGNTLPKENESAWFLVLLSQFNNALVYVLLLAGALSLLLRSYIDASVIFGAVALNILIGFIQEYKANRAVAQLKEMIEHKALVLRDGRELLIESRLLVPGDIILLKAGNRIPADARISESIELEVNEASLTGESMPSRKLTGEAPTGAALADRFNMVYAGTVAVRGHGRAVVTETGRLTEVGRIAEMVSETVDEKTPLQNRLGRFSRQLGILFAAICLLIIVIGLVQGRSLLVMINTGVAVGVASIPEGLTIAVTVILALGMQQILKEKALTRKLAAAETLGSTTVICSDKTGTLTEGRMHVAHIVIGEKEFEPGTQGTRQDEKEAKAASLALQAAMMCNDAFIENPDDELSSWRVIGSPTDAALLSAAVQSGLRREELLDIEPKIDELPFSSEEKRMLTLHQMKNGGFRLYAKGAPEKILEQADKFHHKGRVIKLNDSHRRRLAVAYENLTARGLRVIGLAERQISAKEASGIPDDSKERFAVLGNAMTFIGFIAIKDPLRPEARETVRLATKAGLRFVMITGDHKLTARAIAEEIGLRVSQDNILTGEDLDQIDDERLAKIVKKIDIYARVSPHHKLRLVKALQSRGEVVAMTGDGINDSPALKAADIGISLGNGTDVAKENSDIVLLDNNFATIVSAIRQGRVIFKNIRKVVTFLLSDSFSEMILVVGSILFNLPLAILPAQILWINIINDGFPNFSLAKEKGSDAVMSDPPIKRDEPILDARMKHIIFTAGIFRDITLFGIFWYLFKTSADIDYVRTLVFATLGVKSLMSIFSLRAFSVPVWRLNPLSNRYLLAAVGASAALLFLGVYSSTFQTILSTVPLRPSSWLVAIGVGVLSVILIELVKSYYILKERRA